jgi:hypothetical protein
MLTEEPRIGLSVLLGLDSLFGRLALEQGSAFGTIKAVPDATRIEFSIRRDNGLLDYPA